MKFDIPKKEHPNLERYYKEDIDTAYRFANEIYKELGSLIRAVVIFGSTARRTKQPGGDIDVLVILQEHTPLREKEIQDMAAKISLRVNKVLSVMIMDEKELKKEIDSQFIRSVRENKEVLYGKKSF